MRAAVIVLVFFICSVKRGRAESKSCESYLRKISDFPDGYRGYLSLPILENTHSWEVKITFTHKVRNFDVPQGDLRRGDLGTTTFHVKNRPHNGRLNTPGQFRFEYTIHHERSIKRLLRIKSIEFGSFKCGADDENEKGTDNNNGKETDKSCNSYLKKISDFPDGYRGYLSLPILESSQNWQVKITFTHKVRNFDVPQGDLRRGDLGTTTFHVKNRPYNGRLKSPGTFRFEYTIHHERSIKRLLKIKSIEFGPFKCGIDDKEEKKPQTCDKYVQVLKQRQDGEQFFLRLPVMEDKIGWDLSLNWTKPINCLCFEDKVNVSPSNNMTKFNCNPKTKEILKKDTTFVKKLDVTFRALILSANEVPSLIKEIRFGKFVCSGFESRKTQP